MQYSFFSAAAALLAFSSSVLAQTSGFDAITSPTKDQSVAAGSSLDIIWEAGAQSGTVTISLLQGADPTTLLPGPVVVAGIDNSLGKYTWAIPNNVGTFGTYGFQITLDSNPSTFQYSLPFHITGGSAAPSSSSGSTGGSSSGSSTTTVQIATGPSFTSSASSTSPTATTTTSATSTVAVVTSTASVSSSSANSTVSSSSSTLTTSVKSTTTTVSKTSSGSSSSTSSAAASASANAAVGNFGTCGLALVGGVLLAMAL